MQKIPSVTRRSDTDWTLDFSVIVLVIYTQIQRGAKLAANVSKQI